MVVIFIVILNTVLKCYISSEVGLRFCEPVYGTELVRLWQLGLAEVAFEGSIGTLVVKIWRKTMDKSKPMRTDRLDRKVDIDG